MRLREAPPSEQTSSLQRQAKAYFALAARYADRLTRPLLLFTTGLIASGKSTLAAGVAAALGLRLLSSDRVRKALTGLTPETPQPASYQTGLYSAAMTRRTYDTLADLARQALTEGHSVIIDASFATRAERQRLAALAQKVGAACYMLECWTPEAVLRSRLREREHAPATISDAREEILAPFQRDFEPVHVDESAYRVRLDTTQSVEACVQQALAALHARRP
jgi:predicted kinase